MKRFLGVMAVALGGVMAHPQLPEVYEVFPRTARPGEILTLLGQDFDPVAANNVVHIGGVRANVRESWVSELEVEVPEAAQEGTITIAAGGKIAISPTPFQPLFAPFGLSNAVYRRAATLPSFSYVGIATADLNGDGGAELLCATRDSRVDIWEHVPGSSLISTFSLQYRAQLTGSTTNSTNLVVADIDADGRIDVLLGGRAGFDLFRNIHEGGTLSAVSFASGLRSARIGGEILEIELADIDRDGRLDAIVREPARVSYHLNKYDSSSAIEWLGPRTLISPANLTIRDMTTGDLNQDGHLDVVIAVSEAESSIRIFSHNSKSGTSNAFTQISIPAVGASFVQVMDVEGDGVPDILAYDVTTGIYRVLQNRNRGAHLQASDFDVVQLVHREVSQVPPKILDLNGDSFQDIVRGPFSSGIYYENQSRFLQGIVYPGSFLATTNTLTNATKIVTADLNRDGAQDAIALQGRVSVY
ncbi:MAG: FG-GAP-like repeat-containing protein, partial [Limisphaerales bacterium]